MIYSHQIVRKHTPIKRNSSASWREIGEKLRYYRSSWEANYARYLQFQLERGEISFWEHEPETFWFDGVRRGCVSYLPDFVVEGWIGQENFRMYYEVKGYMDAKSATKIKRFKKYFPNETLVVIDKKWFADNNKKMRMLIKGWE